VSTIHCAINWQTALPNNLLEEMLCCSEYWQPDALNSKTISHQPDVRMAKANLFNRPHSESDTIIISECGQYSIVANAHLDNRDQLTAQLQLKNANQLCDAEFILMAYLSWQENTASHLLGDFVFILWDNLKQQLYCARDHFGVKSLFYTIQSGQVAISNEHKSLLVESLGASRKLSNDWLADVLMPTIASEFSSPFDAIKSLPAAHQLIVTDKEHHCSSYWSLDSHVLPILSDDEYIAELANLFKQAVARRLVTNYPVAAELSEGLDSNGVVGYASRLLGEKPLFTMSFDGTALNESNAVILRPVYQELFDAMNLWPNVHPLWNAVEANFVKAGVYTATFGGPSTISSWYESRCSLAQSKDCRIILSGWGGDHCVSGYGDEYIHELFLSGHYIALYRLLRLRLQRGRGGKPIKAMLRLIIQHKFSSIYEHFFKFRNGLAKESVALFNASVLNASVIKNVTKRIIPYFDIIDNISVKARDYRELIHVGVQNRLTSTEVASRHFRCEFRYPLLDKELVEFAYNLPSHLKCKYGIERYMFREILKGYTTERIRMRRKADVLTTINRDEISNSAVKQLQQLLTNWSPELDVILDKDTLIQVTQHYPHVAQKYVLIIESVQQQIESGSIHI